MRSALFGLPWHARFLPWLFSVLLAAGVPGGAATSAEPITAASWYADVRPEELDSVVAASGGLPRYRIDAALVVDDWSAPATVSGTVEIRWTNPGPGPVSAIPLRLYPNAPAYGAGSMDLADLTVDGSPATAAPSVDGTVLAVPLGSPVAAGQTVDLSATFATIVPVDSAAGFGIFSAKSATRSLSLGHWYPMLAGRDDAGWSVEPLSRNGDPIFSPAAFYDVTLLAPAGLDVVTTGIEVSSARAGAAIERRYIAGPVRDVVIAVDDAWSAQSRVVDGVVVTAYAEERDAAANGAVLDAAGSALASFSRRFGPYPYRELDIVQMDLTGAAGMEFPGLVMVGTGLYGSIVGSDGLFAETVVAHEVAHQWWYGIVGNNNHRHAFIDEGLAEFLGVAVYLEDRYGADVAADVWDVEVRGWWERARERDGDLVVDAPSDSFADRSAYSAAVYPKAALGFAAIRAEIGDDAFFGTLAGLARDRAFQVVDPPMVRAAFEEECGCDVGSLWRFWFESAADVTPAP